MPMNNVRVGIGYDVHAVAAGRKLMLGCVHIADSPRGLTGHSDADVVSHAVCDALLGAIGDGDIGDHFPDTDPRWKDAAGEVFLSAVAKRVRDSDGRIGNIDCVVMCEIIKLGDRKRDMAIAMADHLGIDSNLVNVKATTYEGHGAVGRGEIIACEAIATVVFE